MEKFDFQEGEGGGGHKKNNIQGELPKQGGLGQFADLRGGLGRKSGWCF